MARNGPEWPGIMAPGGRLMLWVLILGIPTQYNSG